MAPRVLLQVSREHLSAQTAQHSNTASLEKKLIIAQQATFVTMEPTHLCQLKVQEPTLVPKVTIVRREATVLSYAQLELTHSKKQPCR